MSETVEDIRERVNRLQEQSSMDHWWPRLEPLDVPTPDTVRLEVVETREFQGGLALPVPDESELHDAIKAVGGPPVFLRSDVTSRKHEMRASRIEDAEPPAGVVAGVVEQHHLSMGMPMASSFYVREWLDLWHLYKTFADGATPLAAEMRLFLLDGEVYDGGFYWPMESTWDHSATEDNWPELWEQTKERAEDAHYILWEHAHRVAEEFDTGYWSVDFALTESERWYAIDMARGELSAHPESVEQAVPDPRQANTPGDEVGTEGGGGG